MRVLIVEDDRTAADFLAKALAEAGYHTEIAGDGETGLELAISSSFGVLIVDRMLPKLDGLSLVERLRARGDRTPVLILSALGAVDDRVKGLRAGGDDYLPKPYSLVELVARVEALARRGPSGGAPLRPTPSATLCSTALRIRSRAEARPSCCNRGNIAFSNISCGTPDRS